MTSGSVRPNPLEPFSIRDQMDGIKHKVKCAKSTEQIEKLAILYQQAVSEFDQQATKVLQLLNQLSSIKQVHQVASQDLRFTGTVSLLA